MTTTSHIISKSDLIKRLESAVNRTLGELDTQGEFASVANRPKKTGIAGNVIENSVLGYPSDNKQRPDLSVDGQDVEVKTTGLRYKKKPQAKTCPYEAKEPMSITAVSPDKIVDETFDTSNFWHKLQNLLLIYYLYNSDKTVTASEYADFPVLGYDFVDFTDQEIETFRQDWSLVQAFIQDVKARNLTPDEGYPALSSALRKNLMFIDTAPKWPHPPRIRLKRSVVSTIAERHFDNLTATDLANITSYSKFDKQLHDAAERYKGKHVAEILDELEINWKPNANGDASKAVSEQIISAIFGSKEKKFSNVPLFKEMGITPKTLVLSSNNGRTEDFKFSGLDVFSWVDEKDDFFASELYCFFSEKQFLVSVFKEPSNDARLIDNQFVGFKRLTFSESFIEQYVQKLWDNTRNLLMNGHFSVSNMLDANGNPRLTKKTGLPMTQTNFMKSSDNLVFIRATGGDATDKTFSYNGYQTYRQQDVWVKGTTMVQLLENESFL